MDTGTDALTREEWLAEFVLSHRDGNPGFTTSEFYDATSPEPTDVFTPRSYEWPLTYSYPLFPEFGYVVGPNDRDPTESLSPVLMPAMDSMENSVIDSPVCQSNHPDPAQWD